jgi:3'(2'),5'-bisphosphate nucleotidase
MSRKPRKTSSKQAAEADAILPDVPQEAAIEEALPVVEEALPVAEEALPVVEEALPVVVAPPAIAIEVDPGVSAGFIHGRFDMTIKGRVVSASPAEEIALHVDGEVVSIAQYGDPEHAAPASLPDGTRARQRAFHFNLPRVHARAAAPCNPTIVARTSDGDIFEEAFELAIDPHGPQPVRLTAGPTQNMLTGAGIRPPVVIYVERAALDAEGNLQIHGWAIALTTLVTVQIFADDERVSAARLGGVRDDVAGVYPAYPNARTSGFSLTVQLGGEHRNARTIRAQAIGLFGFSHETLVPLERLPGRSLRPGAPTPAPAVPVEVLAAFPTSGSVFNLFTQEPSYRITADFRIATEPMSGGMFPGGLVPGLSAPSAPIAEAAPPPPPAPRHEVHMFCDAVALTTDGYLTVSGWAVSAGEVASIFIYLDGTLVGEAEHGHERPDVGRQFGDIPSAPFAGFVFDRRVIELTDGEHNVRLLIRSGQGEEKAESFPIVTLLPPAVRAQPAGPEVESTELEEFQFQLDSPAVADGVAAGIITGRLTIEGWLLARSGVARMEVFLGGQRLGEAHYGLARQDVGAAFPEWDNSIRSGYAFHCPPRSLRDGTHEVRIEIRTKNGNEMRQTFTIQVKKAEELDDFGTIRRRIARVESDLTDALLNDLVGTGMPPRFALYLRQDGPVQPEALSVTLNSLRLQCFRDWHLTILLADAAEREAAETVLLGFGADFAAQVAIATPDDDAWSAPLHAGDSAVALLCPGDELGSDALLELAMAGLLRPAADVIYADESRISPASREREPFFKPDFSPDLLLSTNYIGRIWTMRPLLVAALAPTPADIAEHGEYDLVLRATEIAKQVHHVPKLLCARGPGDLDSAALEQAALLRAADRRNTVAEIIPAAVEGTWRFRRAVPVKGKVSIIVPTCAAHGYIETCIDTLRAKTTYPDYEIIVIDNIPDSQMAWKIWLQQHADKIVDMPHAFNWSRFNNTAVDVADGEFLLFLNDDIEFWQEDWLEVLMEHGQRPDVGIVGPQLLYPDRKVQHAGMFLANNGIGRHAFRFAAEDEPGYFGLALTQRNVMAVTGACMLVRRELFDSLGRFDEAHEIVNNDLDYCLRSHKAGFLTVFTPYATLIHHELASRERMKDVYDLTHFNNHWKTQFAAGDPYFNPNLSRHADDFRPEDEATEYVHAGHPLFRVDDIQRILVVKLDHIGDFVTALPAIRKLKHLFPTAKIDVLAGPASRAFATLEPAIDEFIEFAFFHARSQLGERELTPDDLAALAARLKPQRYDLAVDLRKHLSTRDILRQTGARYLAGFDYMGQFPFLDIALEWDGDKTLQRKRAHVVDDLLSLVAAIGAATESDRALMRPSPVPMAIADLPAHIQPLFDKPVVAIHPGAGNITKQWPEEHFSALIDLLIERNDVNVLLVGGPDEMPIADALMESVLHPEAVGSMAGKTSLVALPKLLAACVLYIGNDSGPKHIAAAMGLPTIGIHSGVVDAAEWGPVGERAVAMRRNMTCSPCYLAVAADCPRNLACLRGLEVNQVHLLAEAMLARPIGAAKTEETPVDDIALLECAADLALQAAVVILKIRARGFAVKRKKDRSVVTEADNAAEALIVAGLRASYPDIPVIAEEEVAGGHIQAASREFWLVDPLDGTREFTSGSDDFAVNIGLVRDGRVVLGVVGVPATGELFGGIVGQGAWKRVNGVQTEIRTRATPREGVTVVASRHHGAGPELDAFLEGRTVAEIRNYGSSLKFCRLAEGIADLYPRFGRTMEWDTGAPQAVLEAAGGSVCNVDGTPLLYGKSGWENPHFVCSGTPPSDG